MTPWEPISSAKSWRSSTKTPRNCCGSLQQALDGNDAELFRRSAHSLKSNSAAFGAVTLAELARELEMLGKEGRLAGAGDKVARAAAEYQRVQQALKELT